MADEKTNDKKSPIDLFREKLREKDKLKENILEGLKSSNGRVRSLAAKAAFKLKDHDLIKKNVLPLIQSDKSKKVLRALSDKITRRDLVKKMKSLLAPTKAADKKAAAAPAAEGENKGA